jgi:hypothetical protein
LRNGIAPHVLAAQVAATAGWALDEASGTAGRTIAAATVRDAARIEATWRETPAHLDYLRLLLSAHYLTVGTFCPTDVDARIRHHFWQDLEDGAELARAVAEVDAVAALDPRLVSARVLTEGAADAGREATLSGHDGEWFSVRAGALGRALVLGEAAAETAAKLEAQIDDELAREARMFEARVRDGETAAALAAATTLAHNTGDLSRVVEAWPRHPAVEGLRSRWLRLGHEPLRVFNGAFFLAGAVNKAVMAVENHRFLALRAPKALRRSRALLLPFGPFFYAWGMSIARALEDAAERAEVVAGLIETHLRGPEQQGVLRAVAGLAEANPGPWSKVVGFLPARLRKPATTGAVQAAIKTPERAFLARTDNRYRAALREAQAALEAPRSVGTPHTPGRQGLGRAG